MIAVIAVLFAAAVSAALAAFAHHEALYSEPHPPLPPLLQQAQRAGGWGACPLITPRQTEWMEKHRREPSQLDEVLRLAFPLGSDERRLTKQLIEQGFQITVRVRRTQLFA